MDWETEQMARLNHRRILGKRIYEGENILTITAEAPEHVFGYAKLKADINALRMDQMKPYEAEGSRGLWIYGPKNTGKSHLAR